MFHGPKISFETLKQRAAFLQSTRNFFDARGFLEVETPLLAKAAHTDPQIDPLSTELFYQGRPERYYLQTSPEFAMKRLLAAGAPPIYQITKAFRDKDFGRLHNPEFTILEWYRPYFDHHQFMQEVDIFLQVVLGASPAEKISYRTLFLEAFHFDSFYASHDEFRKQAAWLHASEAILESGVDTIRQYFWSLLEPKLGKKTPLFVHDFPVSEAALAQVTIQDGLPIAERFEVFYRGMELGNGFHELIDVDEQRARFLQDLETRKKMGKPPIPIDTLFLESLPSMPPCAGIAMGLDRLVLLATGKEYLHEVMAFSLYSPPTSPGNA